MTGRELIKCLECCADLDKEVAIITVIGETEDSLNVIIREIKEIVENSELIGIN